MLRRAFFIAFSISFAAQTLGEAAAQSALPDRRAVLTNNIDYYGADLTPLFDTSFDACRTACLANPDCNAFTFNSRSNACFPKSSVSEEVPYDGAQSARILPTDAGVLAQADARETDLSFLGETTLSSAHDLALRIGGLHNAGTWTTEQMVSASRDRMGEGDPLNAMRWMGAAVSLTDAADQWVEYARLLMLQPEDNNRYNTRAVSAAANGYLRAQGTGGRVSSLMMLAEALEANRRGRDSVAALRLANALSPREDVVAALEATTAKYGFRITENSADNDAENPRMCALFSEDLIQAGTDYAPFVQLPDAGLVVQVEGRQICIDGLSHGARYSVTFREGLPAANGEALLKDVEITQYIRDRAPSVVFPGRAYVLPRAADAALPIETVNLAEVQLTLRRVSDRNLLRAIQDDYFGRPLTDYELSEFSEEVATDIWTGVGEVQNQLNQTMTTRLPMGDVLSDQPPGIYALTARIEGVPLYEDPGATQWFVLTDLGLTTLKGTDGLHVFARGLGDASSIEGAQITLLSRANEVLGTAMTDGMGHAMFAPGLTRGTGGAAPAMVLVRSGAGDDMAFLSLTDPAFDLSDRGVEGRPPAPPVDVFLATDRGAYRAGEVIHATALARDTLAKAIPGLPLTAILMRPDGVEYSRHLSAEDSAGGHVFALPIADTAPRGTWALEIRADNDAPALASTRLLVEDFLPERIDFDLSLPEGMLRRETPSAVQIDARYLFGAPGAGLKADGSVTLTPQRRLPEFPGFEFGRHDASGNARVSYLETVTTGPDGAAALPLTLPDTGDSTLPQEARAIIAVREGSGRPVERDITRLLAPSGPLVGIKPSQDGVIPEGGTATFDVIALGADLEQMAMDVEWSLSRVTTNYQWYQQWGNWNWEPIIRRERVANGTLTLNGAQTISTPVGWGEYELSVERAGRAYTAASTTFYAGWYAPADASSTPDTLELSLDKLAYASGETAQLRLVPRYAGTALITVMSNRVIDMQAVEVGEGETVIPLAVTDAWGAGAYVTAQVIRPMDVAAGQNPARSLGLAHAMIDPGAKALSVEIAAPEVSDPRGPLEVVVKVDGLNGAEGFVTLAAVDLGILNLTGFKTPDPEAYYFGQRRLGVEIRDIYGRLIDGMNGAAGQVRSGGDAGNALSRQSPPPTEDLVAYHTGPLPVGADGTVTTRFDIPDFNGTVRLMAIAWSADAVGHSEDDVLVRDPVVLTASVPRFLAPGDTSRLLLEVVHATGPAGRIGLDISAPGLTLEGPVPSGFDLGEGGKQVLSLTLGALEPGDFDIRIVLSPPGGKPLIKTLTLPVRSNDPAVSQTRRLSLAAGDTFTLDGAMFTGLRAGSASAVLSAGPLSKLNAPGLLQALDRYPYGCTEQIASRAMPLIYFNQVATALGLGNDAAIQARIDQAIRQVLTRQTSNGAFGLWRAQSGDFWLDAYVADFLSRARAEGYGVPKSAVAMAMDNLRNRVNYAPDFDEGGEDIAYALLVLAREGAANMGDLRYYADVKADAFATPLALAQLGAALASYGDQTRADRMFRAALALADRSEAATEQLWRADYGTAYRDRAGLLALITEAGSDVAKAEDLAGALERAGPHMSTQEQAWTLLAARALIDGPSDLTLNGTPVEGPLVRLIEAQTLVPQTLTNTGANATEITLTTTGVPEVPGPADGYGYRIERSYYDMEGEALDIASIPTGTRAVAVLRIIPFEYGEARLMVDDTLPAGLEIDNPNLLRAGDIRSLDWLGAVTPQHAEFRSDRFLAAVDWRSDQPFNLAYIVRAVAPGSYHHPAASVEDMYRPAYRAQTDTARMTVTE